ncbi:uncharacterized protein LOC142982861 [Anticarsia gemmatalis]|uniref:uncharacterized protein LOC142982861 n=1 Tax=Anticarsia gemmatalis TaxID=129554 RepID=UPI003F757CEC
MASDSDVKIQSGLEIAEREFVLHLISLYRDNPVLWDASNEHYTNKFRRIVALKRICDALKSYRPNYTIEELKKKLNILRTNFNKERNKIEARKTMSPEEEPEPILWYYNEMAFLIGQEVHAKRNTSIVNNESNQTKILRNLKRKKISIVSTKSLSSKEPGNEEDIQAKCWAMKLRKLAPDQRLFAEKIINDTLFEAELGTLTRHGATFNAAPAVWSHFTTEAHSPG